jgi:hypothetical protein
VGQFSVQINSARAYLDEQDDFSYVPYGLDILENLAKLCKVLKIRIDEEHQKNNPNIVLFTKLSQSLTSHGVALPDRARDLCFAATASECVAATAH